MMNNNNTNNNTCKSNNSNNSNSGNSGNTNGKDNDNVNNYGNNSSEQELQFNDTLVVSDAMADNSKELLYAHIYNYLLENKYYNTARQFLRDADVPITRNLGVSNDKNCDSNSNGDTSATKDSDQQAKENETVNEKEKETAKGEDRENKDFRQLLEQLPRDQLLRSKMIINSPDTFLLEWWQLFHLLNDFIESSSNDTLSGLDSPNYGYVYPLLPERHPVSNDNNNNNNNNINNNININNNNTINGLDLNPNNNNNNNNSSSSIPIPNENNNPTQQQQQLNYLPMQQPYMPNLAQQMGPHSQTSRSNSTQQHRPQAVRRQMSSQDIRSPPIYSQQSRLQMYPNQGQPSPGINENIPTNENISNFNSNNNYQDRNNQTQSRSQTINNNDDDINNPVNLLKNFNSNGNNINM